MWSFSITTKVSLNNLDTTYVRLRDLYIPVPQELWKGTYVNICMELAPENQNHVHVYLKHSELLEPDDPALRLAIRYQVNTADTTNWLYFQIQEGVKTEARHVTLRRIFKVNSLVDFLDGDSAAETARRPRRFIRSWTDRKWDRWYTSDISWE